MNTTQQNSSVTHQNYDPITGQPLYNFDPITGKPLRPQMNFDPMTGKPLFPQQNFDPITGQPLNNQPRFDPLTGQPLTNQPNFDTVMGQPIHNQPQPNFDTVTGQPINGAHRPSQTLPPVYTAPAPQPQGGEFFVGINLLSKIGVIFIIIGVIAFSAVSGELLTPAIRTAIIFGLGAFMAVLGEVFYRLKSVIFARALTIGGIAELIISAIIAANGFHTFNELATLLVGIAVAAGGLALGVRYNSRTVTSVAVVGGFVPLIYLSDNLYGLSLNPPLVSNNALWVYMVGLVLILLFQTATVILGEKKGWLVPTFMALSAGFIHGMFLAGNMDGIVPEVLPPYAAQLICIAFFMLSAVPYLAAVGIRAYRDDMYSPYTVLFVLTTVFMSLLISIGGTVGMTEGDTNIFGYVMLLVAVVYFALAGAAKKTIDGSPVIKLLLNAAISLLCVAVLTIFTGDLVYIVFHIFAAGLLIAGYFSGQRFIRTWGIITCVFSQCYFSFFCIGNIFETIYIYQFAVNALLWLIIMAVMAMKEAKGSGFAVFSVAAVINAAMYGSYMSIRAANLIVTNDGMRLMSGGNIVLAVMFWTVVWLAAGFALGKLKFLGSASSVSAIVIYSIALVGLFFGNCMTSTAGIMHTGKGIIILLVVNVISVLAVTDMLLIIKGSYPNFGRAVPLIALLYAMLCITHALCAADILDFNNCIISIFYLLVAVAWIVWGFVRRFPLMRRFGLALALLSSAKLFLLDFPDADTVEQMLLFVLFGIILLVVSFIYALFEKKITQQEQKEKQNGNRQ